MKKHTLLLFLLVSLLISCDSPKDPEKAWEVAKSYMTQNLASLIPDAEIVKSYPLMVGETVSCIGFNDRYLTRTSYHSQKMSLQTQELKQGASKGGAKRILSFLLASVDDAIGETYEIDQDFFYLVKGALKTKKMEYIRFDLVLTEDFRVLNKIDWNAVKEQIEELD